MLSDGQLKFKINEKPIYHFMETSTFRECTILHDVFMAKINPTAFFGKTCLLGCGISTNELRDITSVDLHMSTKFVM